MRVFINGSEVNLFAGARVQDGVTAYSPLAVKDVLAGRVAVRDVEGNRVYADGRLREGDRLTLTAVETGESL